MSDYSPIRDFSVKDALSAGDALKAVLGADLDAEFNAIRAALATKYDSSSTVPITSGGTSATTAAAARTALGLSDFATADLDMSSILRSTPPTDDNDSSTAGPWNSDTYAMTSGDLCLLFIGYLMSSSSAGGNFSLSVGLSGSSTGDGVFFGDQSSFKFGTYSNDNGFLVPVCVPFECNDTGNIIFQCTENDAPSHNAATVFFCPVILKQS